MIRKPEVSGDFLEEFRLRHRCESTLNSDRPNLLIDRPSELLPSSKVRPAVLSPTTGYSRCFKDYPNNTTSAYFGQASGRYTKCFLPSQGRIGERNSRHSWSNVIIDQTQTIVVAPAQWRTY